MPSLEDELRSETRCGCYADGAEAHHCLTCRAADRIAELEALLRETHITALEVERERLRSTLIGIVDHWWEFGDMVDSNDDYGFSERIDLAAKLVT